MKQLNEKVAVWNAAAFGRCRPETIVVRRARHPQCGHIDDIKIGVYMASTLAIARNAVARRAVGAATGALLAARLSARLAAEGVAGPIDLGLPRADTAATLDPATRALAGAAAVCGFQMTFFACAVLCAIGVALGWSMTDLPLQSSEPRPVPVGH